MQVNKLFAKHLHSKVSDIELEEHCELIAQLIEASGWNMNEYLREYLSNNKQKENYDN